MKKLVMAILVVLVALALGSCSLIDTALVGTWATSGGTSLTFSSDGKVTGDLATLLSALSLGATVRYEASSGTGSYWLESLLLGAGSKTSFTYSITGDTLVTDLYYGSNVTYTRR